MCVSVRVSVCKKEKDTCTYRERRTQMQSEKIRETDRKKQKKRGEEEREGEKSLREGGREGGREETEQEQIERERPVS